MKVIIGPKCVTEGHELDSVEKFSLWDWINSWVLSDSFTLSLSLIPAGGQIRMSECFQPFLYQISSGQSEDVCHLSCPLRRHTCTVMSGFGCERNILPGIINR